MNIEPAVLAALAIAPSLLVATVAYVHLLIRIGTLPGNVVRQVVALVLYAIYSIVLIFFLGAIVRSSGLPSSPDSTWGIVVVCVICAVTVAPSLYYIGVVRIKDLQRAGFFKK